MGRQPLPTILEADTVDVALAVTWNDKKGRLRAAVVAAALLLPLLMTPAGQEMRATSGELVSVIVRELPGVGNGPERLVDELGGRVGRHLEIIDGFTATVPRDAVSVIAGASGVLSATEDASIHLSGADLPTAELGSDPSSMAGVAKELGLERFWEQGDRGQGVGVALIDSGVVPVDGLNTPGKVINGPDLSFEGQLPEVRYLDTFGHGTHMAGIIAGRDTSAPATPDVDDAQFLGVAPDSHIVNLKVADAFGAADVSQVIAAIDWVVQHKDDPGLNIRVLNLSFGTDGVQSYLLDPLAFAVEAAWHRGIVVVVAAGNMGFGSIQLNNPALDPYVLAVGAAATDGVYGINKGVDAIASFSSKGDAIRPPDILAPGRSIVSLRDPGSFIDAAYPQARLGDRFFRGSGTSQAAAVVSGAAALLIGQRPSITPDQVKSLFMSTANDIKGGLVALQGEGLLDLREVATKSTPKPAKAVQLWPRATGLGSLELARGSSHLIDDEVVLVGEVDVFGQAWDGATWASLSAAGKTWAGGEWLGKTWAGSCWCGESWAGKTWASEVWSGGAWSGKTWADFAWAGKTWAGKTWAGDTWLGKTWAGKTWAGDVWSGAGWSAP